LRAELEAMVLGDLLGPAGGQDEELTERTVRDRYLVGVLAPSRSNATDAKPTAEDDEDEDTPLIPDELSEGGSDSADDGTTDADIPVAQAFLPSSFGLTFCVDAGEPSVRVAAAWGQYKREKRDDQADHRVNPLRVWKRHPRGGTLEVPLKDGPIRPTAPDPLFPDILVQAGPQAERPLRRHALLRQRPGGGAPQGRVPRLPAEARRHPPATGRSSASGARSARMTTSKNASRRCSTGTTSSTQWATASVSTPRPPRARPAVRRGSRPSSCRRTKSPAPPRPPRPTPTRTPPSASSPGWSST
ncbi:MAG: hypothetical protein WKF75_04560, partial [Singulisphaera sp.]